MHIPFFLIELFTIIIYDFTNIMKKLIGTLFFIFTGENRSGDDHWGRQDAVRNETRVTTGPVCKDRLPISRFDGRSVTSVWTRYTKSEFQTGLQRLPGFNDNHSIGGVVAADSCRPGSTAAAQHCCLSSTSTAVNTSTPVATDRCVITAATTAVFVVVVHVCLATAVDSTAAGGAPVTASVTAVCRRSLAGGHRQANRTEVQFIHVVKDETSSATATTPAAAAADFAAATESSGASRQTNVGNTETEHRGPRPQ